MESLVKMFFKQSFNLPTNVDVDYQINVLKQAVALAVMMVDNGIRVGNFARATLANLREKGKASGHLQSSFQS